MTAQAEGKSRSMTTLSADEVSAWLTLNPGFFDSRETLLETLTLSHAQPGASSLIEKQVQVLRKRNKILENKLYELVDIAKDNEKLSQQMHNMGMVLINADGINDIIASARNELDHAFNPDVISINVFVRSADDKAPYFVNPREVSQLFAGAFRTKRCLCGNLHKAQMRYLFGADENLVKSAVFIPLYEHHPLGYISLGSNDSKRFTTSMGTHFLDNLGEMISCAIHKTQEKQAILGK